MLSMSISHGFNYKDVYDIFNIILNRCFILSCLNTESNFFEPIHTFFLLKAFLTHGSLFFLETQLQDFPLFANSYDLPFFSSLSSFPVKPSTQASFFSFYLLCAFKFKEQDRLILEHK